MDLSDFRRPATRVAPDTIEAMEEKGIDIRDQFPKSIRHLGRIEFDLIVNIRRRSIPGDSNCEVRAWDVEDPVALKYEDHCEVRDQIERLVMDLILEFRREHSQSPLRPFGSGRLPF